MLVTPSYSGFSKLMVAPSVLAAGIASSRFFPKVPRATNVSRFFIYLFFFYGTPVQQRLNNQNPVSLRQSCLSTPSPGSSRTGKGASTLISSDQHAHRVLSANSSTHQNYSYSRTLYHRSSEHRHINKQSSTFATDLFCAPINWW